MCEFRLFVDLTTRAMCCACGLFVAKNENQTSEELIRLDRKSPGQNDMGVRPNAIALHPFNPNVLFVSEFVGRIWQIDLPSGQMTWFCGDGKTGHQDGSADIAC